MGHLYNKQDITNEEIEIWLKVYTRTVGNDYTHRLYSSTEPFDIKGSTTEHEYVEIYRKTLDKDTYEYIKYNKNMLYILFHMSTDGKCSEQFIFPNVNSAYREFKNRINEQNENLYKNRSIINGIVTDRRVVIKDRESTVYDIICDEYHYTENSDRWILKTMKLNQY